MIRNFTEFAEFEKAVKGFGVEVDLKSLTELDFNFFDKYGRYVIINLRDFSENPNNLMVLSEGDSFLYSSKRIDESQFRLFRHTMKKKFGESTVLTYLVFKSVLSSYSNAFERINAEIDEEDERLNPHQVERLGRRLRKLGDKVEDIVDLMIKLEDRDIREVNTAFISYDYDVMLAKLRHLLDRIKSHSQQIVGLRNEIEIRNTYELNKRIENLSDVVKKLTAITIIFMIPTIVAGHFGMNLGHLSTLLDVTQPGAEATIIGWTIVAMVAMAGFLKWKDWL
ncbi:hypothetical protein HY995_00895 [Candidatus Micrarchaeota archaeon]|nr:hypothetical protein [Candidatus Micrarchaeota archaeon]MBI5176625.1 hypothetical protein [Candidatus Micrarchaeota archaeon]